MEVTILYDIIHGQLKPWMIDTTDIKKFSEWVRTADTFTPTTYQDLQKKIAGLLTDFPQLRRKAHEKIQTRNRTLQKLFYEIELPTATNPFTQFYASLISNEVMRISNLAAEEADKLTNEIDLQYLINPTLKNIRTLAQQTAEELTERGFTTIPDATSDLTHFALFFLKQMLPVLYFDLQHRYEKYVLTPETLEKFSFNVLSTAVPISITPTESYFQFEVQKVILDKNFSRTASVAILQNIQQRQDAKLDTLQSALENRIFMHDNNISIESLQLKYLSGSSTSKTFFEERKAAVTTQIDKIIYGHKRLDLVNSLLDEFKYIVQTDRTELSCPALIHRWLSQQQDVYTKNAHQQFAPTNTGGERLGDVSAPAKQEKATIQEQKAFAQEQLKFMTGVNVHQHKIMTDAEYKRMINYTFTLIETGKIPSAIQQIPKINLSTIYIRYTYYLIHKNLYGTSAIKKEWIDFLHKVFKQFSTFSKKTTKTKFSTKPSSYNQDMETMKR